MCPGISLHMLQMSPRAELPQRLWKEECLSHLGKISERPHQRNKMQIEDIATFDGQRRHTEINNPNEAIGERQQAIQNRRVASWHAPERIRGFTTPKAKSPGLLPHILPISFPLFCTRHNHVGMIAPAGRSNSRSGLYGAVAGVVARERLGFFLLLLRRQRTNSGKQRSGTAGGGEINQSARGLGPGETQLALTS